MCNTPRGVLKVKVLLHEVDGADVSASSPSAAASAVTRPRQWQRTLMRVVAPDLGAILTVITVITAAAVLGSTVRTRDVAGSVILGFAKSVLDRGVAAGLVLLLAPFVVVAAFTKQDGGPVVYCQERVGLGGRSFRMVKFRSKVAFYRVTTELRTCASVGTT